MQKKSTINDISTISKRLGFKSTCHKVCTITFFTLATMYSFFLFILNPEHTEMPHVLIY